MISWAHAVSSTCPPTAWSVVSMLFTNLLKFFAFHNICEICRVSTTFQDALAIKIWVDLLKRLRSCGGFKSRGTGFPRIFSAP